jgi:hypothetical protein
MRTLSHYLILWTCCFFLFACQEDQPSNSSQVAEPSSYEGVLPAKADNYYSNVASEFEMTTKLKVEIDPSLLEDQSANQETIQLKSQSRMTAFGLYLTTYLTDKFRGIDSNNNGTIEESEIFFRNDGYGGFHAMARNYSASLGKTEIVENTETKTKELWIEFSFDVAGPKDMLDNLPGNWNEDQSAKIFDLQMPKGVTSSPEFINRKEIRNFDPKSDQGELETVQVSAKLEKKIGNAYPHYAQFFEDGVYDLTLFFGHDYNVSRSDLEEAKEAFYELQYMNFTMPVDKFEDLKHDSGAFTRKLMINQKEVVVEVRIFHSNMFETERKLQHDLALSEVVARDVFFYNGHAGPYYGFYLDEQSLAKVDYKEFATAPFSEKQQIFIAQGCQTYSQYADMLYANPAKSEANLDVITTVNYSYGQGTMDLLKALLGFKYDGFRANDFYQMIDRLNNNWINSNRDVYYGVMGIEGNPQLYPFADLNLLGQTCEVNDDCGDANAFRCVDFNNQKQCAVISLSESACPENTNFIELASQNTIMAGACVKNAQSNGLIYGLDPNSSEAMQILTWLNQAHLEELMLIGLDEQLSKNLLAFRFGLDGIEQTEDDQKFENLSQVNDVTGMDEDSFKKLFVVLN